MSSIRSVHVANKLVMVALALVMGSACTPHFNREGQAVIAASTPAGLSRPIHDITANGGSSTLGVSSNFRVSRVVIGGNIQRNKATTSSGKSVQGGPRAQQ